MKRSEPEQYLYEHPNLLDDSFSVSMTEAERWAKEHPVSASALIARAKEKHPEIPEEKWADFEKAAAKRDKTARKAPVVRFRWWYVAVAAVVLIVLTFTLVPPARAWAESVIRYITKVFDGTIYIEQEGGNSKWIIPTPTPEGMEPPAEEELLPENDVSIEDDSDLDYIETTYPDVQAFMKETGYRPVLVTSDAFAIQLIEYWSIPNVYDEICITYESKNGTLIYIYQKWGEERGGFIQSNENDELVQTTVLDGAQVIGYIDNIDHEYVIEIILEDSNLTIMYLGDVDYQTILDALQYS